MLIAAFLLGAFAFAALNKRVCERGPRWAGRVVLALSIAPMLLLLIYCAVRLWLAVHTNDMRYLGADMAFAIAGAAFLIWTPCVVLGAWLGGAART